MKITLLAIGKRHAPYVAPGVTEFTGRLQHFADVSWQLLPSSGAELLTARRLESQTILSKITDHDTVVLLDERGAQYDSPTLAEQLGRWRELARPLVVVIGGAYGVDERLQARADYAWSLSPLIFPHQLVRLLVAEQLYRAFTILEGQPYHHA